MIGKINILRERFGHIVTPDYDLFRDKAKQRQYIQKNAPEFAIKSKSYQLTEISPQELEKIF
jgi:hypothetical protein